MLIAETVNTVTKPSMILVRNRRFEKKLDFAFCFAAPLNQAIPTPSHCTQNQRAARPQKLQGKGNWITRRKFIPCRREKRLQSRHLSRMSAVRRYLSRASLDARSR